MIQYIDKIKTKMNNCIELRRNIRRCNVEPSELEEMDVIHHTFGSGTSRFCVVTKNGKWLGLEFVFGGVRGWNIMEWVPDANVTVSELEDDVGYKYEGKMSKITRVIPGMRSWRKRKVDLKRAVCGAL